MAETDEETREERQPGKAPGVPAFVPWLFMLSGEVQGLFDGSTPLPWLGGAGFAVFVACYAITVVRGLDKERRSTPITWAALAGLVAATYALAIGYGGGWTQCFPLASLATGIVLRHRRLGQAVIVLALSASLTAAVRDGTSGGWLNLSYGTILSGLVTAAILSLFETIETLRATRQELARTAVERERLRFSRDLHDLLGHTLSLMVVKAEAVRRLAPHDLDAALGQAADIEAVGRQALTEVREAVTGYREGSLTTELDRARSLLDASGIEAAVERSDPPLAPQTEALLGWVVREGVTNVVRHSRAGRCRIGIHADEERARLEICDDGRGADPRPRPATGDGGGTGLKGLGERLAAAGGSLEYGPGTEGGFRLVAVLPMGEPDTGEQGGGGRGGPADCRP